VHEGHDVRHEEDGVHGDHAQVWGRGGHHLHGEQGQAGGLEDGGDDALEQKNIMHMLHWGTGSKGKRERGEVGERDGWMGK
jgi:hypothetical protein